MTLRDRVAGLAVPDCKGPSTVVRSTTHAVLSRNQGCRELRAHDAWWRGGGGGSRYPSKLMTSFMNSPYYWIKLNLFQGCLEMQISCCLQKLWRLFSIWQVLGRQLREAIFIRNAPVLWTFNLPLSPLHLHQQGKPKKTIPGNKCPPPPTPTPHLASQISIETAEQYFQAKYHSWEKRVSRSNFDKTKQKGYFWGINVDKSKR